ncbi:MAG: phosphoribosylglycinamide synthetase C domain-containing protein [Gemmatimonadales bacterium]
MYLRLRAAGHEVRVHVSDESSRDVMQDMLDFSADWRDELDWIRAAGGNGIIVFETASAGDTQDELRRDGFNVIGGNALGDRLESDRAYAQGVLRGVGLQTAASRAFQNFDEAIDFLRHSPGRYVFKLNGPSWPPTRNYVGQLDDAADMIALVSATRDSWTLDEEPSFVLMDYVTGVEVGVGAFFNGQRFLDPPNLDWEHKRFFPGDVGELTGEMGTVVTYRDGKRLFDATLSRLVPVLAESGYCGYINLNTIVNDDGVWPLELTCRFGYPGFAILDSLHEEGWDSVFAAMISKGRTALEVRDGYSVGVVLTVPPFPYPDGYSELGKGTPICFRDTLSSMDRDSLHFGEVTMRGGQLVTAGVVGYVMVVTGTGVTVDEARGVAYERVDKVVIPNLRYRNDIGLRLIRQDQATLKRLGWIG